MGERGERGEAGSAGPPGRRGKNGGTVSYSFISVKDTTIFQKDGGVLKKEDWVVKNSWISGKVWYWMSVAAKLVKKLISHWFVVTCFDI